MIDYRIVRGNRNNRGDYYALVDLDFEPKPKDLEKAGKWALKTIERRTASGNAIDGSAFAAYSPAYHKRGTVDLRSSGGGQHMLDALDYRVDFGGNGTSSLEVGIFGNTEKAALAWITQRGGSWAVKRNVSRVPGKIRRRVIGQRYQPARPFLGLSQEDTRTMAKIIMGEVVARNAKGGK